MHRRTIKTSVMRPLTLALVLLLGGVVAGAYLHGVARAREQTNRRVADFEVLLTRHIEEDLETMTAALVAIEQGWEFRAALEAKDREGLLENLMPLFKRLQAETEITHFYCTGPDRVNLVRLHKPDQYGDVIDRFTTLEAERTGKTAQGLELGVLGTLTLRAVRPQFEDGRCIGYLELGHEMSHMIELLRETLGFELGVFLRKDFLERDSWEAGRRTFGQEADWDRFPGHVAVGGIPQGIPARALTLLAADRFEPASGCLEVESGGRTRQASCLPLIDVGGRNLGSLVLIIDVTERKAAVVRSVLFVTLACLAGGGLLIAFFSVYLGRLARRYREVG